MEKELIFCNYCGAELPKGADFCDKCGKATSSQKTPSPKKHRSAYIVIVPVAIIVVIGIALAVYFYEPAVDEILFEEIENEDLAFTDPRDGKTYKTTKIGNQIWMAENLSYNASESKCYNDDPANCQKYGRAYNWTAAKKACPSGWHLPTNDEWDALYHNADGTSGTDSPYKSETAGKYLKAKSGWNDFNGKSGNGLDYYGFAALPGGSYYTGKFQLAGDNGYWWSASEGDNGNAYYRFMLSESDVAGLNSKAKSLLLNVRCVEGVAAEVPANSFTDTRDNKTYKTTKIGKQTWMAENLNYNEKDSKCYDNKPANCQKYGRLYDYWGKKMCPAGWHLPSKKEWQTLVDFAGGEKIAGKKLKAKSGWDKNGNGTDDYGFSALPGGNYLKDDDSFNDVGTRGTWWSSDDDGDGGLVYMNMDYERSGSDMGSARMIFILFSVRCVQD